MKLETEFLNKWAVTDYRVLNNFQSKKNRVFLLEIKSQVQGMQKVVVKKYKSGAENKKKETRILQRLFIQKVNVPQVYYEGKKMIILEYIKGKLLVDLLYSTGYRRGEINEQVSFVLEKLADWFKQFYEVMAQNKKETIIMGDVNFRNLILSKQEIYGLDFESCQKGIPEQDMGRLCAFALTYDPAFTDWNIKLTQKLARIMVDKLNLVHNILQTEFKKELFAIKIRRNIDIPDLNMKI